MHIRYPALTAALGLALTLPALAGNAHNDGHRAHAAHVHGVGDLNVAVEGNLLLIELHGPAANIVGFEHPPHTAAEAQAVADARAKLADPAFTFQPNPEADCRLAEVEVFLQLAGDDGGHDHDGEAHSDAGAVYRFECTAPEQLESLDLALFKSFPGNQRLRVQLITPDNQRAAQLSAGDSSLKL